MFNILEGQERAGRRGPKKRQNFIKGKIALVHRRSIRIRRRPKEAPSTPPPLLLPSRSPESAADAIADVIAVGECDFGFEGCGNASDRSTDPKQDQGVLRERARKRAARADAVIARALEQKSIFDGEVADGEKRLRELPVGGGTGSISCAVAKTDEQPGQWCANGPPCVKEVPPIQQDYAELEGWIGERNCGLRNVFEFGNAGIEG